LLLAQARAELLVQELDMRRLAHTLQRMQGQQLCVCQLERPTPFALPLMVERFRERLSTETLAERLARMVQSLERAADATMGTAAGAHTASMQSPRNTPSAPSRTGAPEGFATEDQEADCDGADPPPPLRRPRPARARRMGQRP
jgi:ATP-dependent Lhr-like helicase